MDKRSRTAAIVLLGLSVALFVAALCLPVLETRKGDVADYVPLAGGTVLRAYATAWIWATLYCALVVSAARLLLAGAGGRARTLALIGGLFLAVLTVPVASLDAATAIGRFRVGSWLWLAVTPVFCAAVYLAPTDGANPPLTAARRAVVACVTAYILLALAMLAPAVTMIQGGALLHLRGHEATLSHPAVIPVQAALALCVLPLAALLRTREPVWRIGGIAIALAALAAQLLVGFGVPGILGFLSGFAFWVGSSLAFLYAFWTVPSVVPSAREHAA